MGTQAYTTRSSYITCAAISPIFVCGGGGRWVAIRMYGFCVLRYFGVLGLWRFATSGAPYWPAIYLGTENDKISLDPC